MGDGEVTQLSGWIGREQVDAITALLADLGQEGWSVGTSQIIATHNLLLALNANPQRELTTDKLANWIGPIVCKSNKQQHEFPGRLAAALKGLSQPPPPPPPPPRTPTRRLAIGLGLIGTALLAGAIWFYLKKPGVLVQGPKAQKPVTQTVAPPTGQSAHLPVTSIPVAQPPNPVSKPVSLLDLRALVAAGLLLVILAAWFARRARREHRLRKVFADDSAVRDYFPSIGATPVIDLEFRRAAQAMRNRLYEPGTEVDVLATIEQTAKRAGAFAPVFAQRGRTPEYLVLIDQSTIRDVQATVFETVTKRLLGFGVALDMYFFDGDPRVCWKAGRGDERFRFETISAAYVQHHLMIFTTGERFLDRLTGKPARWVAGFFSWFQDPAIFTPRPVLQWDAQEWLLARSGALVLPATGEGITAYVARRERRPRIALNEKSPLIPRILEEDEEMWVSTAEPPRDVLRQLIRDLEIALGPGAMQWLAAAAVYPGIDWSVLLYLGKELAIPDFENNLIALARLPWFRRGNMPDWLRIRLLWTLSKKEAEKIRKVLFAMFDQAVFDKSGGQVRLSDYRDLAYALGSGHQLAEHVVLDFMSRRKVTALHLSIPERFALTVEEYLERWGRQTSRRLHPHWAKLLTSYFPFAGFFLGRSNDDEVRWHARVGIVTTILMTTFVWLVALATEPRQNVFDAFVVALCLLSMPWFPFIIVAARRAAFGERLRFPLIAKLADDPTTTTLRWLPPFSLVLFYNKAIDVRRRALIFHVVIGLLSLTLYSGVREFAVDAIRIGLLALYTWRLWKARRAENGVLGVSASLLLASCGGLIMGGAHSLTAVDKGTTYVILTFASVFVGGLAADWFGNPRRLVSLAFAAAGIGGALVAGNHDNDWYNAGVAIVSYSAAFAFPNIALLFGGWWSELSAGSFYQVATRNAVGFAAGWAIGSMASIPLPGWATLVVLEVVFRVLDQRGEAPYVRDQPIGGRILFGLTLLVFSVWGLLAITGGASWRINMNGEDGEWTIALLLIGGAALVLFCGRLNVALRIAVSMATVAVTVMVAEWSHELDWIFRVAVYATVVVLISAAWLLPQMPRGLRQRGFFAAFLSAMPLNLLLGVPLRKDYFLSTPFEGLAIAAMLMVVVALLIRRIERPQEFPASDDA